MISIKIGNEYVDTNKALSIPLELNFNAYNVESVKTSRSFSFDLPYTAKNWRLFDFLTFRKKICSVYSGKEMVFLCYIYAEKIGEFSINAKLEFDEFVFWTNAKEINIRDIYPDYRDYFDVASLTAWKEYIYPDRAYCAPQVAKYDFDYDYFNFFKNGAYVDYLTHNPEDPTSKPYLLMPFFFLSFVVKKVFNFMGYYCENSVFETDEWLKRLMLIYFPSYTVWNNYNYMKFSERLPNMTIYDFLIELVKTFDLNLTFIAEQREVLINYRYNKGTAVIGGYSINNIVRLRNENIIDTFKFKTINQRQINSLTITFSYNMIATVEKEVTVSYNYYSAVNSANIMFLDVDLDAQLAHNFFSLAFYTFNTVPRANLSWNLIDLRFSIYNLFYKTTLNTIIANNEFLKLECELTFHNSFIGRIKKNCYLNYNGSIYKIDSISGNLTGAEYETMRATLIELI